jgi:transcriptional regulator with XRE-family HTH domain
MIRISDPGKLGQTLGTLRVTEGWTRAGIARDLCARTGSTHETALLNLWRWDTGRAHPDPSSLTHYLAALGYDLALIPREDA